MSQFTCGFRGSDFAAEKQNFLSLSSRWFIVLHCVKHQIQMPALHERYRIPRFIPGTKQTRGTRSLDNPDHSDVARPLRPPVSTS